jgi:hypothetical protein
MNVDAAQYTRITQRLVDAVAVTDVASGVELAQALERRIVAAIVAECLPYVTSDAAAERLEQAVEALRAHGVGLRRDGGAGVIAERCFCGREACDHAATLLDRLVGVVPPIGAVDAVRYT